LIFNVLEKILKKFSFFCEKNLQIRKKYLLLQRVSLIRLAPVKLPQDLTVARADGRAVRYKSLTLFFFRNFSKRQNLTKTDKSNLANSNYFRQTAQNNRRDCQLRDICF